METLEAIRSRASLKTRLSSKEVETEKISQMIEAARLAPSGHNNQPWRFVVVRDKDTIKSLAANSFSEGNSVVKNAPVIIIVCADPDDDMQASGREYYLFSAGLAVENMLLAATDLGLVTHAMSGLDESATKKILQIPDNVRVIVATPVAYPAGDSYREAASERLSRRTRKDLEEIAFWDMWAKTN